MKKIIIILCLILFVLPIQKINAQTTNVGFIPANIWYSKDPFEEGDKVKIYTLIFNPDTRELSGNVVFYDKTVLLGKKSFVVAAKGVKDISIDWTVNAGEHTIFAKIENAKFLISAGKYEDVALTENQTEESTRVVNKKITPKATDTLQSSTVSEQIKNITDTIKASIPDSIEKPIILTADKIEEFRSSVGVASEASKEEAAAKIEDINTDTTSIKAKIGASAIMKPVEYVKLFFFTFCSFIFNHKIVFYGISGIFVFLLLRFIWRKIF